MNRSSAGLEGQLLVRAAEAPPPPLSQPVTDWACVDEARSEAAGRHPRPQPAPAVDDLVVDWQLPSDVDAGLPPGRWE